MTVSKKILFDTNVLLYVQNKQSRFYKSALKWHQKAIVKKIEAVLTPQNITEFLSIITNKKRIEKPLTTTKALLEVEKYQSGIFNFIYPNEQTLVIFKKLVKKYKIRVQNIFDTFLVATMLAYGIKNILTYNQKDFTVFKEIRVFQP
jgi:predicted nucleic acid-binding protein